MSQLLHFSFFLLRLLCLSSGLLACSSLPFPAARLGHLSLLHCFSLTDQSLRILATHFAALATLHISCTSSRSPCSCSVLPSSSSSSSISVQFQLPLHGRNSFSSSDFLPRFSERSLSRLRALCCQRGVQLEVTVNSCTLH